MKKLVSIAKARLFAAALCLSGMSLMSQGAAPAEARFGASDSDPVAASYKEACPDLQCEGGMWRCMGGQPHKACFTPIPTD